MNTYDIGDQVQLTGLFSNALTGEVIDPSEVTVKIITPAGSISTYEYGVDEEVVKAETGSYTFDFVASSAGTWGYRWAATGTVVTAAEGIFKVRRSLFS